MATVQGCGAGGVADFLALKAAYLADAAPSAALGKRTGHGIRLHGNRVRAGLDTCFQRFDQSA